MTFWQRRRARAVAFACGLSLRVYRFFDDMNTRELERQVAAYRRNHG